MRALVWKLFPTIFFHCTGRTCSKTSCKEHIPVNSIASGDHSLDFPTSSGLSSAGSQGQLPPGREPCGGQRCAGTSFVCFEQSAMGFAVFFARSVVNGPNPRQFAPTAFQKWIAVALQYLKEIDQISSRRHEICTKQPPAASQAPATNNPAPKAKPKTTGKGKGKPATASAAEASEEA